MMPRTVIKEVGHLDVQFFYHVDADYCKRITDAGYKCYYLPTAAIIHLNHKGGTMANLAARFRSLMLFEIQSYRYYRKHIQGSSWSPMQIAVVVGLSFHFLMLASAQVLCRGCRHLTLAVATPSVGGSARTSGANEIQKRCDGALDPSRLTGSISPRQISLEVDVSGRRRG